ncbi:hypothetical protein K9U39_18590 [Rhodoblastus acidophilus]|uniref:Lectin-like protein BA14k n=1 Tax=Candidatus Rhodoblastus alkanivorans TaxID=2954117 RepID=A0ABS9Z2M8_9HYPH|nr:hypothetical protein [Candidatus Rhodoblastus alkanivorans]MCI4677508.1 hypothetical protein [Candidatus Rhodoblastus alkanivorans]MCI4681867.1 hypothetical protein [Candidatus Rhodoblastus alkanivorans]MDI4642917.1 hypothetical protein [Rhodoblastus acidophilus]
MTRTSSLLRKSFGALFVAGALASAAVVGSSGAQAFPIYPHPHHHHHWGHGWGPGLGVGLAAGLVGAAIASDYATPIYCHWERRYDAFGGYLGRVRVCD